MERFIGIDVGAETMKLAELSRDEDGLARGHAPVVVDAPQGAGAVAS